MSPLIIEIMFDCYVRSDLGPMHVQKAKHECWDSSAGKAARQFLFDNELIDKYERSTHKGRAWIAMILKTPLPENKWIDPRNGAPVDLSAL